MYCACVDYNQSSGGNPTSQHMTQTTDTKMISRRNVAERWSYSIETVKRLEKSGKLPVFKINGQARYRLADIEFIEKQAEVNTLGGK